MATRLAVEVVYARPESQAVVALRVAPGTTIAQAIAQSGLLERHPEVDLRAQRVGVFGQVKSLDAPVAAGDRIEIYRPLVSNPMERRRQRAKRA